MARLDDQRRALAASVRLNRAAENELTAAQARLFVRSLQNSWQVPTIAWGLQESHDQFGDARRLLHAAAIFTEIDGRASVDASGCYPLLGACARCLGCEEGWRLDFQRLGRRKDVRSRQTSRPSD